jgi:hypothetical protein
MILLISASLDHMLIRLTLVAAVAVSPIVQLLLGVVSLEAMLLDHGVRRLSI